jgi:hypothetical protein
MDCAVAIGTELLELSLLELSLLELSLLELSLLELLLLKLSQAVKKRKINTKKNLTVCGCVGCIFTIL